MEEFIGDQHLDGAELKRYSQDPFVVVHGFRRLIAKQRRKTLQKANKQRKKKLIPSAFLADTFQDVQEQHQNESSIGESFWDILNAGERNIFQYLNSFVEPLVQSNEIGHQVDSSCHKSDNITSIGETSLTRIKMFKDQFQSFCYFEC